MYKGAEGEEKERGRKKKREREGKLEGQWLAHQLVKRYKGQAMMDNKS